MSNFSFIGDKILQKNLDMTFDHIVNLLSLSESDQYKGKDLLVSSLRKTIIIHTASIIEALLLIKLKTVCGEGRIELPDEWKYLDIKVLYSINSSEEIIAGKRKKEVVNIDRIDFMNITRLCDKYHVIKPSMVEDIDKVRELRNKLHLGTLLKLDQEYSKKDLEFCFKIASQVKALF